MQAFCGRRLRSLTCAATRLHSCPVLTPLSIFYLPNSKGLIFFSAYAGRREEKQAEAGWGGWEKNRGWLLHPFLLSGAYRARLLPSSKLQRSLPWPAALSIHSSLGKRQHSWKLGNTATWWPLLQGFLHILRSAESEACFSHLLWCSAGPFCSGRSTPCKCCNSLVEHPWYTIDAQPHFRYLHFCKFNFFLIVSPAIFVVSCHWKSSYSKFQKAEG